MGNGFWRDAAMRRTIYRAFWVWNFDKEEKWLNEMAAKGWCLISSGFCRYEFEETLPGEYGICMQLLEHGSGHPESTHYLAFLEETGAEQVGSCLRWVYLRKRKADGAFELFSDNASRIRHLTRILRLIEVVGGMNLLMGGANLWLYALHGESISLTGILNLAVALICLCGMARLFKKRKQLRQERQLFE